eukprot:1112377-Amphidinium_carterae.1
MQTDTNNAQKSKHDPKTHPPTNDNKSHAFCEFLGSFPNSCTFRRMTALSGVMLHFDQTTFLTYSLTPKTTHPKEKCPAKFENYDLCTKQISKCIGLVGTSWGCVLSYGEMAS